MTIARRMRIITKERTARQRRIRIPNQLHYLLLKNYLYRCVMGAHTNLNRINRQRSRYPSIIFYFLFPAYIQLHIMTAARVRCYLNIRAHALCKVLIVKKNQKFSSIKTKLNAIFVCFYCAYLSSLSLYAHSYIDRYLPNYYYWRYIVKCLLYIACMNVYVYGKCVLYCKLSARL